MPAALPLEVEVGNDDPGIGGEGGVMRHGMAGIKAGHNHHACREKSSVSTIVPGAFGSTRCGQVWWSSHGLRAHP